MKLRRTKRKKDSGENCVSRPADFHPPWGSDFYRLFFRKFLLFGPFLRFPGTADFYRLHQREFSRVRMLQTAFRKCSGHRPPFKMNSDNTEKPDFLRAVRRDSSSSRSATASRNQAGRWFVYGYFFGVSFSGLVYVEKRDASDRRIDCPDIPGGETASSAGEKPESDRASENLPYSRDFRLFISHTDGKQLLDVVIVERPRSMDSRP